MKRALIIFAWVSIVGSFGDGIIALYGTYLVLFNPQVDMGITVDQLIKNYFGILYWVKSVAYYVMPNNIVVWLFGLPALVYFPIRVVTSVLIGWWILNIAAKIPSPEK